MALEQELVKKLTEKNYHISFAESCTGGMCSARLVGVADASRVLDVSFVTYANEAKVRYLSVSEESIRMHGVVSEVVAAQMASGAAKSAKSEVGVGITGIAGPTGGSDEKPIGTVCFGFCVNGSVRTFTKHFGNLGRNEVRSASTDFVFKTLIDILG